MIEFSVKNMSCGSCVGRITQAIQAVDAAAKVNAILPEKRVQVDSKLDERKIAEAIRAAGYTPEPARD